MNDFTSAEVADLVEVAREQAFGDAIDKAIALVSVGLFQNTQARDKMVADLRGLVKE